MKNVAKSLKLTFSIILLIVTLNIIIAEEEKDIITQTKNEINQITSEEMKILEEIYMFKEEINKLIVKEESIKQKIKDTENNIIINENRLIELEQNIKEKLEITQKILMYYQKMGITSQLDILLSAKNIKDFLFRVNVLKDISKNMELIIDSINLQKEKTKELLTEKEKLKIDLQTEKENLIREIEGKEKLILELDEYLISLKEKKEKIEKLLQELNLLWLDTATKITENSIAFNKIINSGFFTEEDLNLNYTVFGIKGYLEEKTFNKLVSETNSVNLMIFTITKEVIKIEMPDVKTTIYGRFEIIDGKKLKFKYEYGFFYELPIESFRLKELENNNGIILDFSDQLMENNIIFDIELGTGELKFTII